MPLFTVKIQMRADAPYLSCAHFLSWIAYPDLADNQQRLQERAMKRILVDPFTFEVARAFDRYLSERIDDRSSSEIEKQRLVAILFALKDAKLIPHHEQGRETWFCFGLEVLAEQLELGDVITDEILKRAMANNILLKLKAAEMLRSIELSKQYCADLDERVVERNWSKVGEIARLVINGDLRLIGPEVKEGMIAEDLTRSTAKTGCYVWWSLSDTTNKKPVMADLEEPNFSAGQPFRFPLKAAAVGSKRRRTFVTLAR